VQVEGRTGCVALTHVEVITAPAPADRLADLAGAGDPETALLATVARAVEEATPAAPPHLPAVVPPPVEPPLCRECRTVVVDVEGVTCELCIEADAPIGDDDDLDAQLDDDEAELEAAREREAQAPREPDPRELAQSALERDPCDVEAIELLAYEGGMFGPMRTGGVGADAAHEQHALALLVRVTEQLTFKHEHRQYASNEVRRLMHTALRRVEDAIVAVKEACARGAEARRADRAKAEASP
jgi:hypothetical protein